MVFTLSSPYASAGAFSVTPENFEKAMVLHAVKKLPKATWTNDRDAFYAPTNPVNPVNPVKENSASPRLCVKNSPIDTATDLPAEFVADCVVWSAFADSNCCAALRNVPYKGKVYQIINNLYPFMLEEIRRWPCANGDIAAQMSAANEDRYLAKWLEGRKVFYAELMNTRWMQFKIETWDVGIYQVRSALKDAGLGAAELVALKSAHDALRAKLLPQVYSLGFLNPDVEYFE